MADEVASYPLLAFIAPEYGERQRLPEANTIDFHTRTKGHADSANEGQPATVELINAEQVRYWTERFAVSDARLREALRAVGRDSDLVGLYLSRQNWPSASGS